MAAFVSACVRLFGSTLSAMMHVDIFAFFLAVLLVAVVVGVFLLLMKSAKK